MLNRRFEKIILTYCISMIYAFRAEGVEASKLILDLKPLSMANSQQTKQELDMMKPSPSPLTLEQQIEALEFLLKQLQEATNIKERVAILDRYPAVQEYLSRPSPLQNHLTRLNEECQLVLKCVMAIGQAPLLFQGLDGEPDSEEKLSSLLDTLLEVEYFYDTIGGLIGYHYTVLKLITEKNGGPSSDPSIRYLQPEGLNLAEDTAEVRKAVRWGIENIPILAEIYPVGGAGDRLSLVDDETQEPLPAAQLQFGGRSLLEGLVRDLQAREYLYYKLYGKQVTTPVAMMTSFEKNNYYHIRQIGNEENWFGRPHDSFIFFTQPLVPVISKEGNWSLSEPLKLTLKPGGHGILWKLMHENAIFDVLAQWERKKVLVRQINNPIAGTDHGLLAFTGVGCHHDKAFGFASCSRLLKAPEGMDVVIQKKNDEGYSYCLTNIEYTEFEQRGIKDIPTEPGSRYSAFPSNTNILFGDLHALEIAAEACPIPGLLINMKTKTPCLDREGNIQSIEAGRLESTMQNIADYIVDSSQEPLKHFDGLSAFITFNARRKTISVTKSSYVQDQQIQGTPEGCFYDMLHNHADMLSNYCGIQLPAVGSEEDYIKQGPPFVLWYHPGLGPLYAVIQQKIHEGSMAPGSELQLEISDVELRDVHIDGSLIIEAENCLGGLDDRGIIVYGADTGKCVLRHVTVRNKGIDRQADNVYWKNQITREEEFHIVLKGNAEFIAEDVTFEGDELIEVAPGHRMVAYSEEGEVHYRLEKISEPSWSWNYTFDAEDRIQLTKTSDKD